jgi:hypothetical protein
MKMIMPAMTTITIKIERVTHRRKTLKKLQGNSGSPLKSETNLAVSRFLNPNQATKHRLVSTVLIQMAGPLYMLQPAKDTFNW